MTKTELPSNVQRLLENGLVKKFIGALLICFAFYYVWPLISQPDTMLGIPGDPYAHAGAIDWFCRDFLHGTYTTADIFYPHQIDMATQYDMPYLQSTLACLINGGIAVRYNFIFVTQIMLIILTGYLVARLYSKDFYWQTSFVLLYGFGAFFIARAHHHLNMLGTIWGVTACWYAIKRLDWRYPKRLIESGIWFGVALTAVLQNIPNVFILIIVGLGWRYYTSQTSRQLKLKGLGIIAVTTTLITAPFFFPMIRSYLHMDPHVDQVAWHTYNADALSYLIPWSQHYLAPFFNSIYEPIAFGDRHSFYELYNSFDPISLTFVVLAIYIIWRNKHRDSEDMVILIVGGLAYLLSLGPALTIAGKQIIELPYFAPLASIPPMVITRTPARLGVVFVILFMLLGFKYAYQKYGKTWWTGPTLLLYAWIWVFPLSANLHPPYIKLSEIIPYYALEQIKQDPRDIAVHHLPVTIRGDGIPTFFQAIHHKPVTFGYVSRSVLTDELVQTLSQEPLMALLSCNGDTLNTTEDLDATRASDPRFQDSRGFTKLARDYGIGYLVINKEFFNRPSCQGLLTWIDSKLLKFNDLTILENTPAYIVLRVEESTQILQ